MRRRGAVERDRENISPPQTCGQLWFLTWRTENLLGPQFPHQGAGGQLGKAHGWTEQGVLADSQGMGCTSFLKPQLSSPRHFERHSTRIKTGNRTCNTPGHVTPRGRHSAMVMLLGLTSLLDPRMQTPKRRPSVAHPWTEAPGP